MNESNFTDRARKVMKLAEQEADRAGFSAVGTECLLLGLVKEGAGIAGHVLANLGVSLKSIRDKYQDSEAPYDGEHRQLPKSAYVIQAIELAEQEAKKLNHRYVGTEHLLLGLLELRDSVGVEILETFASVDDVRQAVLDLLGFHAEPMAGSMQTGWA